MLPRWCAQIAQRVQSIANDTIVQILLKQNSKLASVFVCAQCARSYRVAYSIIFIVNQAGNGRFCSNITQRAQSIVNSTIVQILSKQISKVTFVFVCAQCARSYKAAYSIIFIVKRAENAHFVKRQVLGVGLCVMLLCIDFRKQEYENDILFYMRTMCIARQSCFPKKFSQ